MCMIESFPLLKWLHLISTRLECADATRARCAPGTRVKHAALYTWFEIFSAAAIDRACAFNLLCDSINQMIMRWQTDKNGSQASLYQFRSTQTEVRLECVGVGFTILRAQASPSVVYMWAHYNMAAHVSFAVANTTLLHNSHAPTTLTLALSKACFIHNNT